MLGGIFKKMGGIFEEMDKLFDESFSDDFFGNKYIKSLARYNDKGLTHRIPVTDLHETEKEIKISYEIPGIDDKKDIQLNVTENYIEVNAEKKQESKDKKSYSRFYEKMSLPSGVIPDKVDASYKNGILEVILQKSEKPVKKLIEIK